MLGVQSCEISFSSTLEGGGRIRTTSRSRKMKIEFAVVNSMYRLRLPMSTIHHICEFRYATAQSKDDDLTEHYEFNWCLRSLSAVVSSCKVSPNITMMCLGRGARADPRAGATRHPPRGDQQKNGPLISNGTQKAARQIYCTPSPHGS